MQFLHSKNLVFAMIIAVLGLKKPKAQATLGVYQEKSVNFRFARFEKARLCPLKGSYSFWRVTPSGFYNQKR
jgi:hypothetical protein